MDKNPFTWSQSSAEMINRLPARRLAFRADACHSPDEKCRLAGRTQRVVKRLVPEPWARGLSPRPRPRPEHKAFSLRPMDAKSSFNIRF